jgi:hypothetical protein
MLVDDGMARARVDALLRAARWRSRSARAAVSKGWAALIMAGAACAAGWASRVKAPSDASANRCLFIVPPNGVRPAAVWTRTAGHHSSVDGLDEKLLLSRKED